MIRLTGARDALVTLVLCNGSILKANVGRDAWPSSNVQNNIHIENFFDFDLFSGTAI